MNTLPVFSIFRLYSVFGYIFLLLVELYSLWSKAVVFFAFHYKLLFPPPPPLLVCLCPYVLLSLCALQESEEFLSSLVVNKTIYAKVDRLAGIINFQRPKDPNDLLNDWSHKLNSLMSLVNKTTHLIAKEEMIHNLQ